MLSQHVVAGKDWQGEDLHDEPNSRATHFQLVSTRLKIQCQQGRLGSTPTSGASFIVGFTYEIRRHQAMRANWGKTGGVIARSVVFASLILSVSHGRITVWQRSRGEAESKDASQNRQDQRRHLGTCRSNCGSTSPGWQATTRGDRIARYRTTAMATGRLVELADTQDLGSCAERRRGSSPRAAIVG